MPPAPPSVLLSDGRPMPALAWGTGTAWFGRGGGPDAAALAASVEGALDAGFRHLDCAEMYGNEAAVGEGLARFTARTGLPRSGLWVTSKVGNASVAAHTVPAACKTSLARLGVSYLDLYLVHSPFAGPPVGETWRECEALLDAGLVKGLGVSNFGVAQLRELLASARHRPLVNQVELHPLLPQPELLEFCAANGSACARGHHAASRRLGSRSELG